MLNWRTSSRWAESWFAMMTIRAMARKGTSMDTSRIGKASRSASCMSSVDRSGACRSFEMAKAAAPAEQSLDR
jgi:hypothetical protein